MADTEKTADTAASDPSAPVEQSDSTDATVDPNATAPQESESLEESKKQSDNLGGETDSHKVEHSEQKTTEDPKKEASTQKRVIFQGIVAIVIIGIGAFVFYQGLETSSVGNIDLDSIPKINNNDETNTNSQSISTLKGRVGYYASLADSSAQSINFVNAPDNASETSDAKNSQALTKTTGLVNKSLQISTDGKIWAYREGTSQQSIKIVFNDEQHTVVENVQAAELDDWIITPDGTQVFYSQNQDLYEYSLVTKEINKIAEQYGPETTGQLTRLFYAYDGSIRRYGKKSDTVITEFSYDIKTGETNKREIENKRFPANSEFIFNSLSPDGTFILLQFVEDGNIALENISTSSRTSRTIYNAASGTNVKHLTWSPASNGLLFVIGPSTSSTGSQILSMKTGTLERKFIVGDPETDSENRQVALPTWSRDAKYVLFWDRNKFKIYTNETDEIVDAFDASTITKDDLVGWYVNGDLSDETEENQESEASTSNETEAAE